MFGCGSDPPMQLGTSAAKCAPRLLAQRTANAMMRAKTYWAASLAWRELDVIASRSGHCMKRRRANGNNNHDAAEQAWSSRNCTARAQSPSQLDLPSTGVSAGLRIGNCRQFHRVGQVDAAQGGPVGLA